MLLMEERAKGRVSSAVPSGDAADPRDPVYRAPADDDPADSAAVLLPRRGRWAAGKPPPE